MPKRRDTIIIVTNGDVTEKLYLDYFKRKIEAKKNGNLTLDIIPLGSKSEPKRVVKRAITLKKAFDPDSLHSVWAIIEKDNFDDFQEAIELGASNNIKIAYSNISIEYWFLCHFEFKTAVLSVNQLKEELTRKLKRKYEKNLDLNKKLIPNTSKAIQYAKAGHQIHIKNNNSPEQACSSTTIYQLIENLSKRIT